MAVERRGKADDGAAARYAHIRPASFWKKRCGRLRPGGREGCTREHGHRGPHVAHDALRRPTAVWEGKRIAPEVGDRPSKVRARPVGLRAKGSTSFVDRLGTGMKFLDEHAEEIALVVFFVAFVWFALDWLLIILG